METMLIVTPHVTQAPNDKKELKPKRSMPSEKALSSLSLAL
jgi:hypothetical protein